MSRVVLDQDAVDFLGSVPMGGVCGVVGLQGSGKSRLLKLADAQGLLSPRLVYDPYARRDKDHPWPGHRCTVTELALGAPVLMAQHDRITVYATDAQYVDAMGDDFADVAAFAWHWGGWTLVAEECGLYSRECVSACMRTASGGRHAGLRLFCVSQSVSRMTKDLRRHLTHLVICSAPGDETDVHLIRQRTGAEGLERCLSLTHGDPPVLWAAA